ALPHSSGLTGTECRRGRLAHPLLDLGRDVHDPARTGGVQRDEMIEAPAARGGDEAVLAPAEHPAELRAGDHLRLCRLVATLIDVVAGLSARLDRMERHADTASGNNSSTARSSTRAIALR